MHKVIKDSIKKVEVMSYLNTETFEEINKDEFGVKAFFGNKLGGLLVKHASLEEQFGTVCVEDGVKMTNFEDMETEEAQQVAIDVKASIVKLVRLFGDDENMQRLKSSHFYKQSVDLTSFQITLDELETLYSHMLGTPKEEKQSIDENLKVLHERIMILKKQRDKKKDELHKEEDNNQRQKESREHFIQRLKDQINYELTEKDKLIENLEKQGKANEEQLEEHHKETVKNLEAQLKKEQDKYSKLKSKNVKDEADLRKHLQSQFNLWKNSVEMYDEFLKDKNNENTKDQVDLDELNNDVYGLDGLKDQFENLMTENKKRNEIIALNQEKEA